MDERKRYLALDVLRGITVAGMLIVNNSGGGGVYAQLEHSPWNGLTLADLVFPFFMFIMGVSVYFSLSKFPSGLNRKVLGKIFYRGILMFALGIGLATVLMLFKGGELRVLGVVQRLAISYFGGAIIAQSLKFEHLLPAAAVILTTYAVILMVGCGYEPSLDNVVSRFDRLFIGDRHLYLQRMPDGNRIPFDPEGLLSTFPCFAQVLLGVYVGKILSNRETTENKLLRVFIFGTILLFVGFVFSDVLPINKRIWSPTYVLVTCGVASLALALLIWIIDVRSKRSWTPFFEAFGINPLFMYVVGTVIGYVCTFVKIPYGQGMVSIRKAVYGGILLPLTGDAPLASLCYSLLFVMLVWLVGLPLYKRRIYIKI